MAFTLTFQCVCINAWFPYLSLPLSAWVPSFSDLTCLSLTEDKLQSSLVQTSLIQLVFYQFCSLNIFLKFIHGCAGSLLLPKLFSSCGEQELLCLRGAGFLLGCLPCGARAVGAQASVVAALGSQSMGSAAVVHGPCGSVTWWRLPGPGIKPWPPALQADSLLSEPPGKDTAILTII